MKKKNEGRYIVDLDQKTIILLEEGNSRDFLELMKPILSHDREEITYKITETRGTGHRTKTVVIRGWPAYIGISTENRRSEEQSSRVFVTEPIMTKGKYKRVNENRALREMYPFNHKEPENVGVIKESLGMLRKMPVIIPSANIIEKGFPSNAPRTMRDFSRVLSLVKSSAILHQKQRPMITIDGVKYVVATVDDYKIAMSIASTIMEATSTGIPNHVREFYEKVLKPMEDELTGITYNSIMRKYREVYGKDIPRSTMKDRYISILDDKGLISINNAHKPYTIEIDGLTKINGAFPSMFSNENNEPITDDNIQPFMDEICKTNGITECMYKDEKIDTNDKDKFRQILSSYICSPSIRQSFLDILGETPFVDDNNLTKCEKNINGSMSPKDVNGCQRDKNQFLRMAKEMIDDKGEMDYHALLEKLGWSKGDFEEVVDALMKRGEIYESRLNKLKLVEEMEK